jgi:DNA-binding NarL/FixJ family response regulator
VIDATMLRQLRRSPNRIPQPRSPLDTLTMRERYVAELMADGLGTNEIVQRLGVSHSTVRTHVQNILLKLDVHTRLQAVAKLSADERFNAAGSAHAS